MSATAEQRAALLAAARAMGEARLNVGSAGNASLRLGDGFLITPSGMAAEACTPADLVVVRADGSVDGRLAPSSEWQLHRDVYAAHAAAGAVLHAHSPFATALACQRRDIPPFHYMIARFGGSTVRCTPYATFGTQALSDAAIAALQGRNACLLANHGMIVLGPNLKKAMWLAVEVETLAAQYWRALQVGKPHILPDEEIATVMARFRTYGQVPDEQVAGCC